MLSESVEMTRISNLLSPIKASDAGSKLWIIFLTSGAFLVWYIFRTEFWMWQFITLSLWYAGLMWAGLRWPAFRTLFLVIIGIAAIGVGLYQFGYTASDSVALYFFFQSSAMVYWMSAAIVFSAAGYYWYLFSGNEASGDWGHKFAWVAVTLGYAALAIRWQQTYIGHPSWGHIPVTNMYDVMVLFCATTALFYLYYESLGRTRGLGAFAMPMILVAAIFLVWVGFAYHQNKIQPIIPALQSFWLKIHIPMEFVAYANFYLAGMVGVSYLLKNRSENIGSSLSKRLPSLNELEHIMVSMVMFGFLFFTAGTILGAVWAAKAWGGFWSWDPKETWALIVWLNYAAYLHMRSNNTFSTRPDKGVKLAWWAALSLITVTFCFVGVDLFLGGLHSYAKL
ncbi:c-type cytochrome biogenesis protein CcsB [Acidithiobacillus ferrianus]|uniref:C-type cytochrome biogenesis protein CcsB n=2 Tax=Acidithiobacillus ferrianus TaxID=2678518 RepID=A0A845U9U7_9PROT|nr:c-type cytochrome biogenesis protein CcsB [Acidithiobacillus ferrianus]NDU43623.1 c-type cytochrome biogenesis protein CcsB [Acidithiobacillus ferrianus]